MASTASTRLQLELMADGENDTTWGGKTNTNLQMIESALSGSVSVDISSGSDITLGDTQYTDSDSKKTVLYCTGTMTATIQIVVPDRNHIYRVIHNGTEGAHQLTIGPLAGTELAINEGESAEVWCDGSGGMFFTGGRSLISTGAASAAGSNAVDVQVAPAGDLSSTNCQAALEELQGDIDAIEADLTANYQPLATNLTNISPLSLGQGAIIAGTSGGLASVGAGTDGYVLVARAASTPGLSWNSLIPAGTQMVFYQANAPTGWASVAQNDKALRVVSAGSTGGNAGGTTAFSSVLTSRTLSGDQLPTHWHGPDTLGGTTEAAGDHAHSLATANNTTIGGGSARATGSGGGVGFTANGGSHIHNFTCTTGQTGTAGSGNPIDFAIQYCDVILCTKSAYT